MERLELAQLRAALRVMTHAEVADLMCALNQRCNEAAWHMLCAMRTEENTRRMLAHCKLRLDGMYAHTERSGVLVAASRCVGEFVRGSLDEAATLEVMLYALEGALRWASGTDDPSVFGNAILRMFTAFVDRLNRQPDDQAYRALQERIAQLEYDAISLGWRFGETLSECCLDIRWWGEAEEAEDAEEAEKAD